MVNEIKSWKNFLGQAQKWKETVKMFSWYRNWRNSKYSQEGTQRDLKGNHQHMSSRNLEAKKLKNLKCLVVKICASDLTTHLPPESLPNSPAAWETQITQIRAVLSTDMLNRVLNDYLPNWIELLITCS